MPGNLSLRRLVDRFYSRGYSIPLLGLDSCGKTTLLQRLKIGRLRNDFLPLSDAHELTGEIVVSIPFIGVHVEAAHARLDATESETNIVKITSWNFGGSEKSFARILLSYAPSTGGLDALIW